MQRKLLLLHKKHLRDQENEALLESRNAQLRKNTAAREFELTTLLRTLQHEVFAGVGKLMVRYGGKRAISLVRYYTLHSQYTVVFAKC